MVNRKVTTRIDPGKCTGCGLCVQVCPSRTISMVADKAVVTGDDSMNCGHCAAVCPTEAIKVDAIDDSVFDFDSFEADNRWMPPGQFDVPELVRLMHSRRSCRNYSDRPVKSELLKDLVKAGISAPSGTNSQKWTFTILENRLACEDLCEQIGGFFKKLNRMAEKRWLRLILKLLGKKELDQYGLTPSQALVIDCVSLSGNYVTPTEISKWLFLQPQSVSGLVNRMVSKGLLIKTKDAKKRNVVRVSVTEKAEQIYQNILERKYIQNIMMSINKEERKQLESILTKLRTRSRNQLRMDKI